MRRSIVFPFKGCLLSAAVTTWRRAGVSTPRVGLAAAQVTVAISIVRRYASFFFLNKAEVFNTFSVRFLEKDLTLHVLCSILTQTFFVALI